MCIWRDQDHAYLKTDWKMEAMGSCNSVEVGKKGLYMSGEPTMPPHLYMSLLLN
jgi:hypothetical protein